MIRLVLATNERRQWPALLKNFRKKVSRIRSEEGQARKSEGVVERNSGEKQWKEAVERSSGDCLLLRIVVKPETPQDDGGR